MPKQNRQPGIHLHKTEIPRRRYNVVTVATEYYWILISKNGRTIAKSSETYKRKGSAVRSIQIVAEHFENNQHYHDHTTGGDDTVVYRLK